MVLLPIVLTRKINPLPQLSSQRPEERVREVNVKLTHMVIMVIFLYVTGTDRMLQIIFFSHDIHWVSSGGGRALVWLRKNM